MVDPCGFQKRCTSCKRAKAIEKFPWKIKNKIRSNRCEACTTAYGPRTHYTRMGMTKGEFETVLCAQENACAICLNPFTSTPHVDHCHKTNVIRGLLCSACNTALGQLKDSKDALLRAIKYLEISQALGIDYKMYK